MTQIGKITSMFFEIKGSSQDSSSFCLRQLGYLVKLTHTVVSHQLYKRPVGSDLSFQPGTVSPSSTEGPGPVWVHKERLLTHSRSGGDQIRFANTHLPQSTATGSPPRQGWNGYSNIQQPCRGKRADGRLWDLRGEQELWVGKKSHFCQSGNNVT